jgi:hypothetical protein
MQLVEPLRELFKTRCALGRELGLSTRQVADGACRNPVGAQVPPAVATQPRNEKAA